MRQSLISMVSNLRTIGHIGRANDGKVFLRTYARPELSPEDKILAALKEREVMNRKEIEVLLERSQATAVRIIRGLVERGAIVKERRGHGVYYRLSPRP